MDFIPKQRCGHCAKLIASCGIRADDRFSRGMPHIVNIELSAPVFDQAFGCEQIGKKRDAIRSRKACEKAGFFISKGVF